VRGTYQVDFIAAMGFGIAAMGFGNSVPGKYQAPQLKII
jgi:hypothetical protein